MGSKQPVERRTLLAVSLARFGGHSFARRQGMFEALAQAFDAIGAFDDDTIVEDRGDGALIVPATGVSPELLVDVVPNALAAAVRHHNSVHPVDDRFRLLLALHLGEVTNDEHGVAGAPVYQVFRLLDSAPLAEALLDSWDMLALITSDRFFDEVVRRSETFDQASFRSVLVAGKNTPGIGWIRAPRNPFEPGELLVTIYLDDERVHEQVQAAVEDLINLSGAEIVERDDPVLGSWFRRLRGAVSWSPAVREAAAVAAHALDARMVLSQDATITTTMLQNLGPVLTALQPTKEAVLRVGALLIVKVDDAVAVHQLTAAQQLTLDHQPHLLTAPQDILRVLNLATTGQPADGAVAVPIASPGPERGQISTVDSAQPKPSTSNG